MYCIEQSAETRHIYHWAPLPVSTNLKLPIERRRRRNLFKDSTEPAGDRPTQLRRESDQIKARLLHWISLADQALGRPRQDDARPRSYPR